jgi:hypothetical protein
LGWTYSQDSIFGLTVSQINVAELDVGEENDNDSAYAYGIDVGGKVDGFGLYVGDTDAGNDVNNLFANNLQIIPEPAVAGLVVISGIASLFIRRFFKK